MAPRIPNSRFKWIQFFAGEFIREDSMASSLTTQPPDKPLLQGDEPPVEDVFQTGAQVSEVSPEELDTDGIVELGDEVLIEGGLHDQLHGYVYYRSEKLIRILPAGVTNLVIDLPLDEYGEPLDILQINTIRIVKKRIHATFVENFDIQAGFYIETFIDEDTKGPSFKIVTVDKFRDSCTISDSTGASLDVPFEYIGIPLWFSVPMMMNGYPSEQNVRVFRSRQKLPEQASAEAIENAEEAKAEGKDESAEDDEGTPLFQIVGKIKLPKLREMKGYAEIDQPWFDNIQRPEMITDLLRLKDIALQDNEKILSEVRRTVELFVTLRNDIVSYDSAKLPMGEKPTSVATLIELLETNPPLCRLVLDVVRNVYLDSKPIKEKTTGMAKSIDLEYTNKSDLKRFVKEQFPTLEDAELERIISEAPVDSDGIHVRYLAGTIRGANQYMDQEFPIPTEGELSQPAWVLKWKEYIKQFTKPWTAGSEKDKKAFRDDKEFFLNGIPDLDEETVPGLKSSGINQSVPLYNYDNLKNISFSYLRGLTRRRGRPTFTEEIEVVEPADAAPINSFLLFPLDTIRDLGPTRTGKLIVDCYRALTSPTPMAAILAAKDGVQDVISTNSIIPIKYIQSEGEEGTTIGNYDIEDYLSRINTKGIRNFGDFYEILVALGLNKYELTISQKGKIQERIEEEIAFMKEILRMDRESQGRGFTGEMTNRSILRNPEDKERFLSSFDKPILKEDLEIMKGISPYYYETDLGQFAFIYKYYQDYVDSVMSGDPSFMSRERIRVSRDEFLKATQRAHLIEKIEKSVGEPPKPNTCEHVPQLDKLMKIKEDKNRMRILARFLTKYKGPEMPNSSFYSCIVCSQNLICKHEVLLMKEFFKPLEGPTLHKELILNYSGGIFHGDYICSSCGQPIQELEYDTHLEYDDNGNPMSGRSVLVDLDKLEDEAITNFLGAPADVEEEIKFDITIGKGKYKFRKTRLCSDREDKDGNPFTVTPNIVIQCIYRVAKDLFRKLGIEPPAAAFKTIVQRVHTELMKVPEREKYVDKERKRVAKAKEGSKAKELDYDIYLNRLLVATTAAHVLLNIQSSIPEYLIRFTLPNCEPSFKGFPRGPREDKRAMEYISCAAASIQKEQVPYTLTGFLKEGNEKKRANLILKYIESILDTLTTDSTIQQELTNKTLYLDKIVSEESQTFQEKLPQEFLPLSLTKDQISSEEIVKEAAKPIEKAEDWMVRASSVIQKDVKIIDGSAQTTTSCCFVPIEKPGSYWEEKGLRVDEKTSVPKGSTGTRLFTDFKAPELSLILPEAPEKAYARVFLKICFRGPRMGLPHEVNLMNYCPHCKFQFPYNPYLKRQSISSKEGEKEDENLQKEGEIALRAQGVIIDSDKFQEVLDATHRRNSISKPVVKAPITQDGFDIQLLNINPAPYDSWRTVFRACLEKLAILPADAPEDEQINAWKPLLDQSSLHENALKTRIGQRNTTILVSLCKSEPYEIQSSLITYFITPFSRALGNFRRDVLKVPTHYNLADQHENDIKAFLKDHTAIQTYFDELFDSALIKGRAEEFVKRLAVFQKTILPNLRKMTIRRASGSMLQYIARAFIFGICYEYCDLNRIPKAVTGEKLMDYTDLIQKSLVVLSKCIQEYEFEQMKFTDERIREMMTKRAEEDKNRIRNRLLRMSKELRGVEMKQKLLGMGEWARGADKGVYAYSKDMYDKEREDAATAGSSRWIDRPDLGPDAAPFLPGRNVNSLGFANTGAEDGYDVDQTTDES